MISLTRIPADDRIYFKWIFPEELVDFALGRQTQKRGWSEWLLQTFMKTRIRIYEIDICTLFYTDVFIFFVCKREMYKFSLSWGESYKVISLLKVLDKIYWQVVTIAKLRSDQKPTNRKFLELLPLFLFFLLLALLSIYYNMGVIFDFHFNFALWMWKSLFFFY